MGRGCKDMRQADASSGRDIQDAPTMTARPGAERWARKKSISMKQQAPRQAEA